MPKFSVVIPTYNRLERVLRAVRSVLAQRYADYEIIVVDDGSTDGTRDALHGLGRPVRVLVQDNAGPARARNAGVRAATGDYVAFLDSDDVWLPWTLDTFARSIERHGGPSWLSGAAAVGSVADTSGVTEGELVATSFSDYAAAAADKGLMPLPSGVAIARARFLAAQGFSEAMRVAEDLDLWFRLAAEKGFVKIDSPPLYLRESHEGNLTVNPSHSSAGMLRIVERERAGAYAGTKSWNTVRRAVVTRQLLEYAYIYANLGERRLAARFYFEVLRFQARSGFREAPFGAPRNQFLFIFPWLLAGPAWSGRLRGLASRVRSTKTV